MDSNLKKLDFNDKISSFSFALIDRTEYANGKYLNQIFPHK